MDAAAEKDDWITAPAATATAEKDDWVTAPAAKAEHWAAPEGGEFGDLAAQSTAPAAPQGQIAADLNSVGQGLVSGAGSAIAGAGRIAQAGSGPSAARVLAALNLVDEGKNRDAYQKLSDVERQQVGAYRGSRPEDKQAQRDALQQTIADYDKPNAVTRAGMAVEDAAPKMFPVEPQNEGIQTGVGRLIGGAAPALAAGAVGGPVGVLASLATIGSQAFDGAYQDAVSKGATHDDADDAAGKSALAQAALMVAPVGRLLQRVPMPMRDGLTATLVNLGQHGVEFGSANALGTFANNYVAQQSYDPSRSLTQGTGHAALEGAIAGLVIPVAASAVRGTRQPAATIGDIAKAPDIDGAIAAAGEAARAPADTQFERLNWGDIFTPQAATGANDIYPNPRARTPTAIDAPSFMPPGAQVPADVVEATRPDFIPPAPASASEAVAIETGTPAGPSTQIMRQGTTAPGTSILNSNSAQSPTRAANDVNPLLPPPANDAEAYPAWNASKSQQSTVTAQANPSKAQTLAGNTAPPADIILTPTQTVQAASSQPASTPQSVGAAASRDMTHPSQIEMPADEFAANRLQGETERLAAPPRTNDQTIYVPGTKPTLAEVSGDPRTAMDQAYNAQQPEAMGEHTARANKNADAVADYYADTAGSAQELLRMERAKDERAAANINQIFGSPDDIRPPADATPVIEGIDNVLDHPRQQERGAVTSLLTNLRDRFFNNDGTMKTDPYSLYGIRDHIGDLLNGVGNTETSSAARVVERELMQIRDGVDQAIENAVPGFAKFRAEYSRDSGEISAKKMLQEARLSLLSGTAQHITPAKWFTFMRNVVEGRSDPFDPASHLSEAQMDRLWNITDHLKRSTLIDAGKPRGSWTSMMQEWGGKFARLGAHGVAGYTFPVAGNLGVEMLIAANRKRNVSREMNRLLNPDLGQQAP
jgi:hypothetical protein